MFTGIIEEMGKVLAVKESQANLEITIQTSFTNELRIDQSVSHNGVCLTISDINEKSYSVIAVDETLSKTNLGNLSSGDFVNIERCLKMNGRVDGHFVQGHVDTTATVLSKEDKNGSWIFTFEYPPEFAHLIVEKGSVCINGVSLTVVSPRENIFSVAIIPYTYEHTTFSYFNEGEKVNLEFDILGKYIARHLEISHQ